ncbi:MAG: hypothetical protein KA797_04750 [Chitinophagales bacterium]|nr:hypothetical protein [Chitinophagales bacterium]
MKESTKQSIKFLKQLAILAICDYGILWLLVKQMNPEPSTEIGIIVFVPFIFLLNLFIALVLFFKKREYALLFAINSLVAAILAAYLYEKSIENYHII